MRLRLQAKALLFFGLLMALGLGAVLLHEYRSQRTVLVETSEHHFLTIADNLADEIFRVYEIDDWRGLQSYVEHSTGRDRQDVVTVAVIDTTSTVVAAAPERLIDHRFNQPEVKNVIALRKPWVSVNRAGNPWTIEILTPVTSESAKAPVKAVVYVVGSLQSVQDELQADVRRQVIVLLIVTGVGFLFTLVYVRRGILRPIRELSAAIQRVVAGDFHKLSTRKTHDEIGELASSFEWMTEELRKSQEYLQDYNRTLMQMVAAEQDRNQLDRVISSIAYALIEIDNRGDICRWNKAATEIFGLPPESVLGRPLHDSSIPWDWSQVAGLVDSSLDDNQSWHRDGVPYRRPDQTQGYLTLTLSRVDPIGSAPEEPHSVYVLLAADATERKRAADEVGHALSLLQATIESTGDGILVVDQDGRTTICNKRFGEMWRIPEAVLASRDDEQALKFVCSQLIRPDDFLAKVRELYNQPEAESWDVLEFKDGRVFERYSLPQYINGKSVGRVWSFRDITRQREAEKVSQERVRLLQEITIRKEAAEKLRVSEEKYRALFESSRDAVMTLTPETGFLSGNRAAVEMFGCRDEQEFTSKTPDALSSEYQPDGVSSAVKAQEMMKIAIEEGSNFFEWTHRRVDGTVFLATVLLSRMTMDGRNMLQATVRDISEQARAGQAIARLAAAAARTVESAVAIT